jgi:hypothetical protein
LQAVAISSILSAIIFSRSCQTGYGEYLLPFMSFLYWWGMLYVYFSGCSFAQIGCLAAALSPFVLVVRCPAPDEVSGRAGALPLWIGVRGFIIALFIMTLAEYFSSKDGLVHIAYSKLDEALTGIKEAMEASCSNNDPSEKLAPVGKLASDCKIYSKAAEMEPRFWKAKWKHELCVEVADLAEILRLDITFMRQAMCGADNKTKGVFGVLAKIPTFEKMHQDLIGTLDDARQVTHDLLRHEWGEFKGLQRLHDIVSIDELDGWVESIEEVNKVDGVAWPKDTISTIEDDLICQISIICMMLNCVNTRVAGIITACVRQS